MSVEISTLAIKVTSSGVSETADGLNKVFKEAGKTEKRVETLTDKIKALSASFMAGISGAQAYASAINTASGGITASSRAQAAATPIVERNTTAIRNHTTAMNDAHAAARGLSGSLGALWVTYGNALPLIAGAAIGLSFKQIVSVGKDVEHILEAIRVKGMESVESINKIRDSVMELGKGVYGPREIAAAFETLILAGLNAKQALSGISDALNLATVGGTTIEKSAYTLVQVGTALGYTAESYGRISDVIAMTAAVSMSSVETLSEAFKSGSVVGKLYGVTLVDIGTSLAALSNLGIQGSAAGTSLKNFYKELASSSEKVKATLKDMHLAPADFKDAQGNYLGVLQVVEKLATGLGNLTEAQGKIAIANLSNERGMKTAIELLDLYKQKVDVATEAGTEHGNMLAGLRAKIEDSYGFAAIGAAAMSLTVESQFKSVANTLQTVFLKAFQQISPQMNTVASKLKDAFNSPEFILGIQSIATSVANLVSILAQNIPTVVSFVEAVLAMKAFMFIVDVIKAMQLAFVGLTASASAASIPLLPLTVALLAAGAAYAFFTREREASNLSESQRTAIKYTEDYADALDKEATRLNTQLNLMREGKTAMDAETESMYAQQLAMAALQRDKTKTAAEARLERAGMNVSLADLQNADYTVKHGGMLSGKVKEFKEAQAGLVEATAKADAGFARVVEGQKAVMSAAKAIEQERQKQTVSHPSAGVGMLSEKPDKGVTAAANAIKSERVELERLLATYNAKTVALVESAETEQRVMAHTERDRVKSSSNLRLAEAVDIAKFEEQKAAAITENSNKITNILNGEADRKRYANVLDGESLGIVARKTAAIMRYNGASEAAIKLEIERAKIADKVLLQDAARTKLTSAADSTKLNAESLIDEADAMFKYGVKVKQTALELAQLLIEKSKLTEETGKLEIAHIKEAAALKQIADSYNTLAKLSVETGKGIQDAEAHSTLLFADSEAAKVKIRADAAKKMVAIALASAEVGYNEATKSGPSLEALKTYEKTKIESTQILADIDTRAELETNNIKLTDWKKTVDGIEGIAKDGFASLGESGVSAWRTTTDTFKKMFKTSVIDYIYKQFAKPFVLQVIASVTGAMGMTGLANAATASSGTGGAGGLIGMAQQASSAYNAITTGFSGISGSVAEGVQTGINMANGMNYTEASLSAQVGSGPGAFAQGAGTVGSYAAGAYAGHALGNAISGDYSVGNHGQAVVNVATVIGSVLGGPIGGAIGGAIGGLVNRAFGMGSEEVQSQGLRGTISSSGTTGESYKNMHQSGGWFRSDDNWTDKKALTEDIVNTFTSGLVSMKASSQSFAKNLDVSSGAIDSYSKVFDITLTNDTAANQKTITTFFTGVGDEIATTLVPSIASFAKVGETASTTLQRLSETFTATNQIAAVLGRTVEATFGGIGLSSDAARERLVNLSGSLSALGTKVTAYSTAFLTDAEKIAPVTKAVSDAMSSLGLSSVTTKEQFKAVVNGLDLTTESGATLFTNLMDIAPAFAQVADYTDTAGESLKSFQATLLAFKDSLLLGSLSILTPMQKLVESQNQYEATLAKAKGGDTAAQSALQGAATNYLTASQTVNASGAGYTSTFDKVTRDLSSMDGSHASGLVSVPFDGYRATLHKDETVVDAQATNAIRRYFGGKASNDSTNTAALEAKVEALLEEIKALRADQNQQTGAIISSNYDANDRNANKVVAGSKDVMWANNNKAIIK